MAAPSTVYKDQKLSIVKGDSLGGVAEQRDLYIAKFLQNTTPVSDWGDGNGYFNSTDTDAEKIAKIKDIFKIDGWARIEQGGGVEGFVGYCFSRTSGNGLYHNWDNNTSPFVARGSGVKLDTTVLTAELLNDSGLNRKADITITPTSDPLWTFWANWINFPMSMRASFYDGVTDWGYSWKIGAGGTYADVSTVGLTGTLGVKVAATALEKGLFITGLDYLDVIYFKPYITSSEGTFYGTELHFTADEAVWTDGAYQVVSANGDVVPGALFLFATASDGATLIDGSTVTISDASTGIFLYLNEYFVSGNLLPTGYYVIGAETTKAYYIVNGQVRKYETRTPATASVSFYLIDLGAEGYPEWRVIAQVVDAAGGFPNHLTVATVVTYYTESGGTYTPTGSTVNVDVHLNIGDTRAQSALSLIAPPEGATYAKVTTTEAGIGLAVISDYTAI